MKDIIIGLLAVGIGMALVFSGYRIARILIPIWGFFAGFIIGSAGIADALNRGFVSSTMAVIVGLIIGLLFALLAYFFFSISIVLLSASLGYWVGTGLFTMLGLPKGFLSATIGILVGAMLAIVAIAINAPKYYLIVVTGVGGALATATGLLIMLNKESLDSLSYASSTKNVAMPVLWIVVTVVLAIVGIGYQIQASRNYELQKWGTPFER